MNLLLAIDPGSERSALLGFDPKSRRVVDRIIQPNDKVLHSIRALVSLYAALAIEHSKVYLLSRKNAPPFFPQQVFDTAVWVGRFKQTWIDAGGRGDPELIGRREVKLHLLGRANGNDSLVRHALLDIVGPSGTKRKPGPTYGVKADLWAALGVAVTVADRPPRGLDCHA